MLEKLDRERLFNAARKHHLESCDIYAEVRLDSTIELQGRIEDVRFAKTGGISLRGYDGDTRCIFTSTEISTQALLRRLGVDDSLASPEEICLPLRAEPYLRMRERVTQLAQIMRTLSTESDLVLFPRVRFEGTLRHFEVIDETGSPRVGTEECGEVVAHWALEENDKRRFFSRSRALSSIQQLFDELKETNPFLQSLRSSLNARNPWPAPSGNIPVLWSARALSKLCLQFLRGFEGDLVLGNLSFLNNTELPLRVNFTIEDQPQAPIDHEGSPTRAVTLFKEGRPKALAVNRRIADELAVASTGHARREAFDSPPTVGLWTPRFLAGTTCEEGLSTMTWGISLHDIEVLSFDPATADLRLRLTEAYLIHHGAEGEPVEKIEFNVNLLEVLEKLSVFSSVPHTEGFHITKRAQRIFTEITVPAFAQSKPIRVPGSVPLNHYW